MSLTDELKRNTPKRPLLRGHGRQAFLARRNEIAQALTDGYTSTEVWEFLHNQGTMPIQYRTFIDYVNRYILADAQTAKPENLTQVDAPSPAPEAKEAATSKPTSKEPRKKADDLTRRFQYDAKGKTKEDLI